uniref:Uncharacterized protein n=1 Tax=Photinus pyralis TaxID=7054 RepID=A0A1Y1MJD6_PHOPY
MDEHTSLDLKQQMDKYQFLELLLLRCLPQDQLDFKLVSHDDHNFHLTLDDHHDVCVIRHLPATRKLSQRDFDEGGELLLSSSCPECVSRKANYFIYTNCPTDHLNLTELHDDKFNFLNFTNLRSVVTDREGGVFIDQVPSNLRLSNSRALQVFASHYNLGSFHSQYILDRFYAYVKESENFTKEEAKCALLELFICKYKVDLAFDIDSWKCNDFWNSVTCGESFVFVNSNFVSDTFLKAHTIGVIANFGDASELAYKKLWFTGQISLLTLARTSDDVNSIVSIVEAASGNIRVTVLTVADHCDTVFHLDYDHVRQLLGCKVSLQGKFLANLGDLVDPALLRSLYASDIISLITNNFVMDYYYKELPPYFIERSFLKIILRLDVVNDLRNELFVVRNEGGSVNLPLRTLKCLPNVIVDTDEHGMIEKARSENRSVHFVVSHGENWLEWTGSWGCVENLRQFEASQEYNLTCDFRHLVGNKHSVHIIIDSSMGKSTLLDYIALSVPEEWVITVDLQQYIFNHKPTLDHVYQLFKQEVKSELAQKIFKQFVDSKKIHLLLDRYDAIAHTHFNEVVELLEFLQRNNLNTWLPVGPNNAVQLTERLGTIATVTKPFSAQNQHDFLTKYFSQFCNRNVATNDFVNTLLRVVRTKIDAFLDSPLYLKFIADIYTERFKHFCVTGGLRIEEEFVLLNFFDEFLAWYLTYLVDKHGYCKTKILPHLFGLAFQSVFDESDLHGFDYVKVHILQELVATESDFPYPIFVHYVIAKWMAENVHSNLVKVFNQKRSRYMEKYANIFRMFDLMLAKNFPLHTALIQGKIDEVISSPTFQFNETDGGGRNIVHIAALYGVPHPKTDIIRNINIEDNFVSIVRLADTKALKATDTLLEYSPLEYAINSSCLAVANAICEKAPHLTNNAYIDLAELGNYINYCGHVTDYKHLFKTLLKYIICVRVTVEQLRENNRFDVVVHHLNLNEVTEQNFEHYLSSYDVRTLSHLMEKLELKKVGAKFFAHLQLAAAFGNKQNILDLLKDGAMINNLGNGSYTPLHAAVMNKRMDNVDTLLAARAKINITDALGNTALHIACQNFGTPLVRKLISKGADISIQNKEGDTPFHHALKHHCEQSAELFLPDKYYSLFFSPQTSISRDRCLDVNIPNKNGDTPLLLALQYNCTNIVRELLEYHADVHVVNKSGNSCLHYAAKTDDYKTTLELIHYRVNVNQTNSDGETPLLLALKSERVRIATLLLSRGARVNDSDKLGMSCLHYAAQCGLNNVVVNLLDKSSDIDKQNNEGETPLKLALVSQHLNTVLLLLNRGANPNITDHSGCNGLHHASNYSLRSVVTSLIANGCLVNHANGDGDTPLITAINNAAIGIVGLLIKNGADVNVVNSNGLSCLHLAVTLPTLVEDLLRLGLDVNKGDNNGTTPLMVAIERQCEVVIKILTANGADIFAENKWGLSAIHYAAQYAQDGLLLELIDKGADVNKKNHNGETPLLVLLKHWYVKRSTTKILLDNGGDTTVIDNETGNSLLHLAAEKGYDEIVEMLFGTSANINLQNNEGDTPLHFAIKRGRTGSINQLLLSKGADPNITDRNDNTCLHSAIMVGVDDDLITLLLKNGANVNAINNHGDTPISRARRLGHGNILSILSTNTVTDDDPTALFSAVKNGEIHIFKNLFDVNKRDGNTLLMLALKQSQIGIVDYLLSSDIDVKTPNDSGLTCLHLAAELGDARIVRQLLSKGCEIDAVSVAGDSPLLLAVTSNRFHIAQLLLDHNASTDLPSSDDHGSCLHAACTYGSNELVSQILQRGGDVNQLSKSGSTPLLQALTNNHRQVAITLIQHGADANLTTEWGWSSLTSAAESQYLDVINLLLDKGAQIDYLDGSNTALKYTISNQKREAAKLLLSKGANVHLGDEWNGYPLHHAAQYEMDDIVSLILDEGFDINKNSEYHDTALFAAASRKNFTTVKLLMSKGAPIDTFNGNLTSFLGVAAENGWEELVAELIASGADIHHENHDRFTPLRLAMDSSQVNVVKLIFAKIISQGRTDRQYLHCAAEFGDNKIVSALLHNGYDINELNSNGETPLLLALKREKLNTAKLLLAEGADCHEHTSDSCLHYFAQFGWNEMVSKMLQEGCDVNIKQQDGATPLLFAVQYQNFSTVQLLLSHGADPTSPTTYGRTPLYCAIENNCKRTLKALLDKTDILKSTKAITSAIFTSMDWKCFALTEILIDYSDCTSENETGETMLFVAVKNGCENLVRQILAKDRNVNEINSNGNTILMAAVENGNVNMITLLLEYGADPNIVNKTGNSCLHYAVRCSEEVLFLFVERCALNLKNADGLTPLLYALEEAYTHSAQLLIAYGADIHIEDAGGNSSIHYAVKVGAEELVKYLMEAGLDIHKKNAQGDDCLDLAISKGYVNIIKLLVSSGANVHQVNRFGENCLLKVVEENNDYVVDLLEKGINIDQQSNTGFTPFTMALEKASTTYAKMMLAKNADVHIRKQCGSNLHFAISQNVDVIGDLLDLGMDINEQDQQGNTPLLLALDSGLNDIAKLLLERGANVHIRDNAYDSCLHNTIPKCDVAILSTLIDRGADVNCRNLSGETPLLKALKCEKLQHAKVLLEKGVADYEAFDNNNGSCLFYAAKAGYEDLVCHFISKGVKIDQPHYDGNAYLAALREKHLNVVKVLIDNGADIWCRTNYDTWLDLVVHLNDTDVLDMLLAKGMDINYRLSESEPLIIAALREKCRKAVDYLIAKGADLHVVSYETGNSCLHYAVSAEYEDVTNLLLDEGLDINRENNERETPLRRACIDKHAGMIKLLLSRGASLDEGNFRFSYMHYAAELGDDAIVTDLIQKGVDLNAINRDGDTPLFLAVLCKNVSTVKLLLEHGADYNITNKNDRNLLQVAKSIADDADDLIDEFVNLGLLDIEL